MLAEQSFPWSLDKAYALNLRVEGQTIRASVDGHVLFEVQDDTLSGGAIALLVDTGSIATEGVRVSPL